MIPESPNTGFVPKKSLGQNFLTSATVPEWLCAAAALTAGETVYEIGPGTGRLTAVLLAKGAKVVAVETDKRAYQELQTTFAEELKGGQLKLILGDAKTLTPTDLGLLNQNYKVIANVPYYLSGFLLRQILTNQNQPQTLVFLLQKELVERIARSRKESLLSLSVKCYGQPKYVKTVGRGHFTPQPKVSSAILAVTNINRLAFSSVSEESFFQLLHLGFGQKRKQLLGNLSQIYTRDQISSVLTSLNLPITVRAEDLTLENWLGLTAKLTSA